MLTDYHNFLFFNDFLKIFISVLFIYFFTSQYFIGFCHTTTWIRHGVTCVPHPEHPSHLPPHPIPLGHPSAPAPSTLYHASNLDWRFVSHVIISATIISKHFSHFRYAGIEPPRRNVTCPKPEIQKCRYRTNLFGLQERIGNPFSYTSEPSVVFLNRLGIPFFFCY